MAKKWINWTEDCPNCGSSVEVLTDVDQASKPEECSEECACYAGDGDEARCTNCKWTGSVNCDGAGYAYLDDGNLYDLPENE